MWRFLELFWTQFLGPSVQFSSVQFSRPVVFDSLQPHEPQHARAPCPSPTPGVHPNSCSLSRWCHPTISSSVVPFFSCLHSFPTSGSFPMSQLFASGGPSIGVSASTSVLPVNTQDWSPLRWTGWMNKAAVNVTDTALIPWLHFFWICPEMRLLNSMVVPFLIFWGSSIFFSITVIPCYVPTNSIQGF